jgi:hypothetical protein
VLPVCQQLRDVRPGGIDRERAAQVLDRGFVRRFGVCADDRVIHQLAARSLGFALQSRLLPLESFERLRHV